MTFSASFLRCILSLVLVMSLSSVSVSSSGHYTNEWAVDLGEEASDEDARRVASSLNCVNKGVVLPGIFLLEHRHVRKRSIEAEHNIHTQIASHPDVKWSQQQRVLSRKKRQLWSFPRHKQPSNAYVPGDQEHFDDLAHLNDKRWPQMWYLNRGSRLDMNVQEVWRAGVTGKGVSITILDDGIEKSHPDLIANYDPLASFDVNDNDADPTPRYDMIDSNRHGTRCAGEVAATANNSLCAVGIAFGSGIGGVRMLDGDVTDAVEARSLGLNNQHVAIYSASWGPDDDGQTVDGPNRLATAAFLQGIEKGRGGKGSIFVWASGNGGRDHDNCNCDGYTNAPYTLSVSSATENGLIPWYSEACASTLATTYSSGSTGERKIVTTDLHHTCTSSHTGTSASAPLAAGIIALMLEVNPELGWRDAQHLTVLCAHVANLQAPDWSVNALGRNFSHSFGYGIMDAACMVRLARHWKPVKRQLKCSRSADHIDLIVAGHSSRSATIQVDACNDVRYLEHVQAHVSLQAGKRGDIVINLISPSGTKSTLVDKRPRDYSRKGFLNWPFLTVHMWGEKVSGTWTLEVINQGRSMAQLKEWRLSFLGTDYNPIAHLEIEPITTTQTSTKSSTTTRTSTTTTTTTTTSSSAPSSSSLRLPNCLEQESQLCTACESDFLLLNGHCVDRCPKEGYFQGRKNRQPTCLQCYYMCRSCYGPSQHQCSSCFGDAELKTEQLVTVCMQKTLVDRLLHFSRWYTLLSIGFLANLAIVIILVSYIVRWRSSIRKTNVVSSDPSTSSAPLHFRYNVSRGAGAIAKSMSAVPFHDYLSSSDDEELARRPFRDDDDDDDTTTTTAANNNNSKNNT